MRGSKNYDLKKYFFLFFYPFVLFYMEIIIKLAIYKTIWNIGLLYMMVFIIPISLLLYVISTFFSEKANKRIAILLTSCLTIIYISQLVYQRIFYTYYTLYSVGGAGQVFQFWREVLVTVKNNVFLIIILTIPLVLLIIFGNKKITVMKINLGYQIAIVGTAVLIQFMIVGVVQADDKGAVSSKYLYYETFMPDMAVNKFGLLTSMKLDLKNLLVGLDEPTFSKDFLTEDKEELYVREYPRYFSKDELGFPVYMDKTPYKLPAYFPRKVDPSLGEYVVQYNTMDINFELLASSEKNEKISIMHQYFNSLEPTKKNRYTNMFEGKNLIMITAEAFSTWAIDPVLTPTLYKMTQEGFNFTNFYTPSWGVSTSDGEYVTCTGLIPKTGVWSFYKSGSNAMPFTMGNQFSKLGYGTRAYHNHSYSYYSRDVSHPNMGYVYKGIGNGLEITSSWPESDLEMINVTMPEFIGQQPFHTYYMTVSGHLQYNFAGNAMAAKNKALVQELPYSDGIKAYIACNIELDRAMEALIAELEAKGIAENTVISISPDHYPYGLTVDEMSEIEGSQIETNFEMYHTTFILWNKGMRPTTVHKPCSSLDIMPTLSNLFGLTFDSRLFMGRDILSDADPIVIFSNRSWITDKGRYNSVENKFLLNEGVIVEEEYCKKVSKVVNDKFAFSAMLLDQDYYSKVMKE